MLLTLSVFLQLAAAHAPSVARETLAAFAQHESGLDPNAVHDDTTGLSFHPEGPEAATALAASLLARGHGLDLGLMQVNSANLARAGLTVRSAFDPGESLRAGAQILVAAYQQCRHRGQAEPQLALRCAASVYNTGTEQAGILNGYQAGVWQAAAQIVPAIQAVGRLPPAAAEAGPGGDLATSTPPSSAVMEDLLHGGASVPVPTTGLEDALPHHGGNK